MHDLNVKQQIQIYFINDPGLVQGIYCWIKETLTVS